MSKLEKDVEAKVKKWCDKHDVLYIKFTPFGSRGWPDRIVIFPNGVHIWLELKRRGKVPRKIQTYRMNQLNARRVRAVWSDDADNCITYLEQYL